MRGEERRAAAREIVRPLTVVLKRRRRGQAVCV